VGDVYCRKCGEPWDFYYVTHEMIPTEQSDFVKGMCCPRCREKITPEEPDRERALASIIESLNEIEGLVIHLDQILSESNISIVSPGEADAIASRFFFRCQITEERVKTARKKEYVTDIQVRALNNELHTYVQRMIPLMNTSPILTEAVRKLLEAQPSLQDLLVHAV
jgi:hypothetical protein